MRISDEPHLIEKDYKTIYTKPYTLLKDGLEVLYKGMGISPKNHPLKDRIRMQSCSCGNCKSNKVEVIYAHWVVHPMSGDVYWDYEIHCNKYGKFTLRSHAEND